MINNPVAVKRTLCSVKKHRLNKYISLIDALLFSIFDALTNYPQQLQEIAERFQIKLNTPKQKIETSTTCNFIT